MTLLCDYRPSINADERGFFGKFGGAYVAEILRANLDQLSQAYREITASDTFWLDYLNQLEDFSGRPTALSYAARLSEHLGGAQIYFKREDLNQTGAHKLNNVLGQGMIAKRLGKKRLIAETGAGQHGVATATIAARLGLEACIYMGSEDIERQRPNVFWMEQLGAKVVAVSSGSRTLKDAINEALRDWSSNIFDTHYLLGTACGPHPFPSIVAYLQRVIGFEALGQLETRGIGFPAKIFACVGGGSNALGIFQAFLPHKDVELIGVEAGGKGLGLGEHASRIAGGQGRDGIVQGYRSIFLQNAEGQMSETHSVSAGLDYVGISPILADLAENGRVRMESAFDLEVIDAVKMVMKFEGIIPALESAHALAAAIKEAKQMNRDQKVLACISGRGDKDIFTVADVLGDESWFEFLRSKASERRR